MLSVGHHFPLSEMVQWPLSQDSIQIAYIGLSPRSHDQYLASSASPILLMSPLLSSSSIHLAQIHYAVLCSDLESLSRDDIQTHLVCHGTTSPHSSPISIDPDSQLPESVCSAFKNLHNWYDRVFDSKIGLYNDASGPVRTFINMGPTDPPAQKVRLPSYSTDKLNLLQDEMDEIEQLGVLA